MALVKRLLSTVVVEDIEKKSETLISASHQIHDNPEIGNEEYFASELLTKILENEGFEIEKAVAGHETSFVARKKSDKKGPKVAFLAEYDALIGLGHACGHNLIGTISTGAAIGLSSVLDEIGGEVLVYGTPAEEGGENGSAKASFVKQGYFDDVDVALIIHPGNENGLTGDSLALDPLDFEFFGKPAHAAGSPHEGINALDAMIQLFNGINALRQQLKSDIRIHGIITHGGDAPNIIPEYTKARFYIRAKKRKDLDVVTEKVKKIVEASALATGCTHKITQFQNEIDNLVPLSKLDGLYKEVMEDLGEVFPVGERDGVGSTDAGNVSHVIPTAHPRIKIGPSSLVGHTKEFREASVSTCGDKALITGAKALALTALELYVNKDLLNEIKEEFKEKQGK